MSTRLSAGTSAGQHADTTTERPAERRQERRTLTVVKEVTGEGKSTSSVSELRPFPRKRADTATERPRTADA